MREQTIRERVQELRLQRHNVRIPGVSSHYATEFIGFWSGTNFADGKFRNTHETAGEDFAEVRSRRGRPLALICKISHGA